MKRPSKWAIFWLSLLAVFVVADLIASKPKHRKPRSASEYLGHLFPRGWKRAVLIALLAGLLIHIATQPQIKSLPDFKIWRLPEPCEMVDALSLRQGSFSEHEREF